jgi:hypothetical protein
MKGSDVDFPQGKMATHCVKWADYRSQFTCQRQQQFGADDRETEFNFYGTEAILENKASEIVQQP